VQGRNPLPKREVTTNFVETQTDPKEIVTSEEILPTETIDVEV
jgi:hypothetical protein